MANKKISDLTDGTAIQAGDLIEIERPGAPAVSRKIAIGPFATAAQGTLADNALAASLRDADGTLAANSATRVPSQSAVVTYVAAAIAAIRNGVSAAFDTLAEIATELALKATINSPTFTGTPAGPTAAVDTNTTQIATAAFVIGQAAGVVPLVDGVAAIGTSKRYARADHVHPTDTSLLVPSIKNAPYNCKADCVTKHDGAITSGSKTLTSATASFGAGDIGKTIVIQRAAATQIPLVTTIASINSATSVELTVAAGFTVSGEDYYYGTDNTAGIQSALDSERSVYIPGGTYLVNGELVLSTSNIRLYGENSATTIKQASRNSTTLKITGNENVVEHLLLYNPLPSTSACAALRITGATHTLVRDMELFGGFYCLWADGNSTDIFVSWLHMFDNYGGIATLLQNTHGYYCNNTKHDQNYPVAPTATLPNDRGAWAATTAYAVADMVTNAGWYMQCTVAGTSGSSAPTLRQYHRDIPDGAGALVWQRAGKVGSIAVNIDSFNTYSYFEQCDATGVYQYGFKITNDMVAGVEPTIISIRRQEVSGMFGVGIWAEAGDNIVIDECTIHTVLNISSTQIGIMFNTGFDGGATITKNQIWGVGSAGIRLHAGRGFSISDNSIGNCTNGIYVSGAVTEAAIIGNRVGNPIGLGTNTTGIRLDAVASNYLNICHNINHGATTPLVNNSTGANNTVQTNT